MAHPPSQAEAAEVRFAGWEQRCQKAPGMGSSCLAKEHPSAWATELMESKFWVFWGRHLCWGSKPKPGFCLSFTQWILNLSFKAWLVLGVASSELGPSLNHGVVFGQTLNVATFHLQGRALTLSPGSEVLKGVFGLAAVQSSAQE